MRKSKALTVRRTSPILILVIGLVLWLILRNKQSSVGEYRNLEEWSVEYNSDGLPTKISIHRKATRQ